MIFRFRYWQRQGGAHVHIRLFAGPSEVSLAKCGEMMMRNDEFEKFRGLEDAERHIPLLGAKVEFIKDEDWEAPRRR